jgi:hypothetical protein
MKLYKKSGTLLFGRRIRKFVFGLLGAILCCAIPVFGEPSFVNIPGSFQTELGCPGSWQTECPATYLELETGDGVWQKELTIPMGNWEYKAALDNSWTENYGQNAMPGGANIQLSVTDPSSVKFYYSHRTHWITDNLNSVIATLPGSFQSALGCPGDWQPDCLVTWLQDPDGDGTYHFGTNQIPPGVYDVKVAVNEGWRKTMEKAVRRAVPIFGLKSCKTLLKLIFTGIPKTKNS